MTEKGQNNDQTKYGKTINNVSLMDLLPPNLTAIPEFIAVSAALDKQWHKLACKIKGVLTFADIDHACPEVVDMLAAEMNVDFYDPALDLCKRRALVKNGYVYKYTKGTADVVQQVVTDAFDKASVEEWFDYGGGPYHFRVVTEAGMPSETTINQIFKAIDVVKNVRSRLDYLGAERTISNTVYCLGFGVYQRHYQKITA
jgi:P2-related tail formation protein